MLDLYDGFYSEFDLLVMLTCNLKQLRGDEPQKIIVDAKKWLNTKVPTEDDAKLETRFKAGVDIFDTYTKILYDEGVIAMPTSGGR